MLLSWSWSALFRTRQRDSSRLRRIGPRTRISHSSERLEIRRLLAITVTIDYSLDTNDFFSLGSTQREVLTTALNEVANNLNDALAEIVPHKDNAADTWTAQITNPSTGADEFFPDLVVGGDEIRIYVGARQLGSSTLGVGGFGGASIISGTQSWIDRVVARGQAGALLTSGSETDFAPWGGSLSFDIDANWHFGLDTQGLSATEVDFYSVAAHEFTHLLGFGTAPSWDNLVFGLSFNGPASTAEYDLGGSPPLSPDQGHWADGTSDDGAETAMDPSLLQGTRKPLTKLDYAGLDDLGWDVSAGAGAGGGSGNSSFIQLADGSPHSLLIEDDGIAGNGISQYTIDGGTPVEFDTTSTDITVAGGDMDDTITVQSLDSMFTAAVNVNGSAGDDALHFDHAAAGTVTFNGSSGTDLLSLMGTAATAVTYNPTSATDGQTSVDDGTTTTFSFANTESLEDLVSAADRVFTFAGSADNITLRDDNSSGNGRSQLISLSSSPEITFANPSSGVTVNTEAGDDIVVLDAIDGGFAAGVSINGGDGNDQITAISANYAPTINGNMGDDSLIGSSQADMLLGNPGNDTMTGLDGNDSLLAGAGADSLVGGDGNDFLNGHSGNGDTLTGDAGNDTLNGGIGIDLLVETADVDFTLTGTTLTGLGTDMLFDFEQYLLVGGVQANLIDVSGATSPVTVLGGGGNDSIIGSQFGDTINGQGGHDTILSGDGDDCLQGGDGNDSLNAGLGQDLIDAGNGNDIAFGAAGNDTVLGGANNDILNGDAGDDSLLGGDGADQLIGADGNDALDGEGGNGDSVSGGLGNDTLRGGSGTDLIIESGDVNFTLTSTALTGLGSDSLIGIEAAHLTGGPSANAIDTSTFTGSVTVLAGAGNDTVICGAFNDSVIGEDGNDSVLAGGGNDTLLGAAGADTLRGEDGNDFILGQGGSLDSLYGGPGNDVIDSGAGNDRLFGEDGNDTLRGGDGLDYLLGGSNDDSLLGGTGNDTIYGEAGNDTINGGADNDFADGGDGDDGLSGFTGNDSLVGNYGEDTIYGGEGNDALVGGAGRDTIFGQAGSDTLNGNGGVDKLVGGSGSGSADAGDRFNGLLEEIDETFSLSPQPDWVDRA